MTSSTADSAPALIAGSMNWDPVRQRLLGGELEQALSQALELRSSIEILHSTEFPLMLSALLPSLTTVLTTRTRPSPDTTSVQHRLRNAILDIISKFPLNEVLRPHAPHIVAVARDVLTRDYEDNAVIASRIIFDLYKVYRNLPQDDVQPYMDFVVEIYRTLPLSVKQNFSLEALTRTTQSSTSNLQVEGEKGVSPSADEKVEEGPKIATPVKQPGEGKSGTKTDPPAASPSAASLASASSPTRRLALRSNASFRVLTESPLIVMLLFQLYPRFVKTNIPAMIGTMINALALRAPRLEAIVEASEDKTAISSIKRLYYDRYREMIASQAKTLSFLTYLLRGFSSDLKPYEEKIAINVVDLMRNCPRESVSTRKELLVATRHLLNSDFRAGFYAHIDYLLDERILMGSHYRFADHTLLRPLAYTTLSDLVQHFRSKMSIAQVSRVVVIFSRVLHELASGFPVSTQYAAVRTIFSVVDIVHGAKDAPQQQRRPILVRIMRTLVDKLYAIVAHFPSIREPKTTYDGILDVVQKRTQLSSHGDTIREIQSMVRAIVVNLKTVLNYVSAYRSSQDEARGSSSHEMEIVERYIRVIFPAAKILKEKVSHHSEEPGKTSFDQYRDVLTYFAASFAKFDASFLRETFGKNLDHLVEAVAEDNVVMVIPRHLLVCNPTTSYEISSIMLDYLVKRMPELCVQKTDRDIAFLFSASELDESDNSNCDAAEMAFAGPIDSYDRRQRMSSAILLLFERILKSLASFHNNERIVRKYLRKIVVLSIRSAMQNTSCWPDANCMLLRYTFRSISAGKFEESYKELLPLIPSVLNGLYRVMCSTSDTVIEHTSIELCLTIPARLSSLLPHLNLLLRVIIPALDSDSGDLVNLGLRTLEFWIDNLNVAFLYPEISKETDILSSLMRSLSRHLRPAPYPYGLLTLRLLGKLGGKNRIFLRDTITLVDERPAEDDLPLYSEVIHASGTLDGEKSLLIPIPLRQSVCTLKEIAVSSAIKCVESKDGKAAISWDESHKLWTCDLEGLDIDAYTTSVKGSVKESQARAAFQVVVAARNSFFEAVNSDNESLQFPSPFRRTQGKLLCVGLLFYAMVEGARHGTIDLLGDSVSKLEPALVAEAFKEFLLEIPDSKLDDAMKVIKCIFSADWMTSYSGKNNFQSYLLRSLTGSCSAGPWGKRIVISSVVELIIQEQGMEFCRKHETELLVAAFGCIKNAPKEVSFATAKAGKFFLRVCFCVYGEESFESRRNMIQDPLFRDNESQMSHEDVDGKASSGIPSDEAVRISLQEMVSPEEFVRISARLFLKHFVLAFRGSSAFSKQIQVIRRLLFSRHLRLLPLCHQVGLIESLSFILKEIPGFFPLNDQHVLNFLSELLKMCSVADGEMSDKSLFGHVVDKNGYCASGQQEKGNRFPSHAFALFCRRKVCLGVNKQVFVFPQEAPPGVQLRVAAISLIHSVVAGGSDLFFDSEPSTSIGNIRPHMISLLFRSLVSVPSGAVKVSHDALKEVLSLSSKTAKQGDTTKTQSRLPKDLLQMCIRPVLLNLRDYTRLSIPLLRGLTKLLSLLSSWFNKTLGEKLLDHLQRWVEPHKIIQLGVWNEGEEPMVAAAIVDVFRLLPQASKFVEVLVGTCVKIESVIGEFKMRRSGSPLRESLARYLNKYSQAAIEFFFRNLKIPTYAELFTSILRLPYSGPLRACLCQKQSSVLLLNVCFERPLAIMRAEKSGKVAQGRAALALHGIGSSNGNAEENKPPWPMTRDAHEVQLQGLKVLSILLESESSFFEEHGDIVRAIRLLWRSRGRFLRLQNEEKVHPRFHDESRLMADFLQKYASRIASSNTDAFGDVVFELLCIFLQSPSYDFSGLRNFLQEAPSALLPLDQQKGFALKLIKRLGSESNEETKILSIQLLVLPLLMNSRRKKELSSIIDAQTVNYFLGDIMLTGGGRPAYSDRLRVEFLQLLSVFVQGCPDLLSLHRDKAKVYCLNLLKSEDATVSSWAFVVLCMGRVQKCFDTTDKVVRDLYESLLRAHQQEGKDLVRAAMDMLIPALPDIIPKDGVASIVDHTSQAMIVESNQTQHVAHVCLAILKGKILFEPQSERFAGMIVGTLNRLGLSSGGPFENKFLAAELVQLLLEWDESSPKGILSTDEQHTVLNFCVRQLLVLSEPDVKQMKVDQGAQDLSEKLRNLLKQILEKFSGNIRPQHFERFSVETSNKIDASILFTSLEVLSIANHAKKRIFFEENKVEVARILTASFSSAKENVKFQKKLLDFAKDAFTSSRISDAFALSLEKILLDALQRTAKAQPPGSESRRTSSVARESPTYNFAYLVFCMDVLHIICKKTKSFINRLEHVLLQVAGSLAKDHVSEAIAKQRQGSSNAKATFTGVLHHTPTRGILHECLKKESYDSRTTSSRAKSNKSEQLHGSDRALFLSLAIFEEQDIAFNFTHNRKALFQIIGTILDHSHTVMLLIQSTRVVGKWLLTSDGLSPVIVKERNSFLWKLSSFDIRCLPNDVAAQPLIDAIRHFIHRFGSAKLLKGDDFRLVFGRLLVASLLHPNTSTRKDLMYEYLSITKDQGEGSLNVLWKLLHSDFEGIGNRYITAIFTEAILKSEAKSDNELVQSLCTLVHGNERLCQDLFELVLPWTWSRMEGSAQARLARATELLLSRSYHSQFLHPGNNFTLDRSTMNTPRSFLNAIAKLRPIPVFDVSLLVSLAEKYNAWFEVLSILEMYYQVSPANSFGHVSVSGMRHCYRQLSEESTWLSLASESCSLPGSREALRLDMGGFLNRASDAYLDLIDLVQDSESKINPTEFEMDVWEERWVETQRELCQSEVVSDFANASTNYELQLECAWRNQDWAKVKSLCLSSNLLVAGESGNATVKLSETLLAVADGKLSEVENLHAQSAQLCLNFFQLLPQISHGSIVHGSLFHFFHRLVEVRESGQIMVETSTHSDRKTLPDLKNLLNAWRGRLPNDYEKMTQWESILSWRNHMFGAITKNFHWSEPNMLASLHDRPWTAIRLAKTARKQGLRNTSMLLLNKASDKSTMNVLDAFLQLREQITAYLNPLSDVERQGGLNLINTTNLSFFDRSQTSELFRLKAAFLDSLEKRSKANQAFCHCVQLCPSHSRAWVDWGNLCAVLGAVAEQQAEKAPQAEKAGTYKKVAQYLAQAIGCYLEAIRIDTHEWARLNIAKCLWMLSKDGSPGVLGSTFENRGSLLPSWVWLPWLPQLLSGLCRPEGPGLKQLLTMVARVYPQAIYYGMRAFYLERRDVERAKGPAYAGTNQHMPSVQYAEEMLSLLRRSHASLCAQLETILEELIVKFRPSTEEDFLGTIVALLERVESQVAGLRKSEEESMSQSCWKTLGRIAVKYFRQSDSSQRSDARSKQSADFKEKYRKAFEEDFQVDSAERKTEDVPNNIPSLLVLLERLRGWREKIRGEVFSSPSSLRLIQISRALAVYGMGDPPDLWPGSCDPRYAPSRKLQETEFNASESGSVQSTTSSSAAAARKAAINAANASSAAAKREGYGGDFGGSASVIEVPGSYTPNSSWTDARPTPELHPKLVKFDPSVDLIRRKENLVRRIGMVGDDGVCRRFVLQCSLSYWTRVEERQSQTSFVIDKILRKGVKTSRAHISIKPQPVVPVAQRLRLVYEPDHWTSLEREREVAAARSQSRIDFVDRFNKELQEALSSKSYDEVEDVERSKDERENRLRIFRSLLNDSDLSPSMLKNQISVFLNSTELIHHFRRTFAKQLAADCLLQYAFGIAERNPEHVVILRSSGAVLPNEAKILYNSQGYIEREKNHVPFRFTRNLSSLIGFPLVEGQFMQAMVLFAEAVDAEKDFLNPIFQLLMRDDLLAFFTKTVAKSDSSTVALEKQLQDRVVKNTSTVQSRFSLCAPSLPAQNKESSPKEEGKQALDHKVRQLVAAAQDDENLSMMPSTFQAWL